MTYAPDERARFVDESHRIQAGRCVNCGASPRWPIAEQTCPLRGWDTPDNPSWTTPKVRARIGAAIQAVNDGATMKSAAESAGLSVKTVRRYMRVFARQESEAS